MINKPDQIERLIKDAQLVVDATGNAKLTDMLSYASQEMEIPMVSGALYRAGYISRIQRQIPFIDSPIYLRQDDPSYQTIEPVPGLDENATPATGCSAPVNNAPPASVMVCATQIAQTAIEVLMDRHDSYEEITEVFRPVSGDTFDKKEQIKVSSKY